MPRQAATTTASHHHHHHHHQYPMRRSGGRATATATGEPTTAAAATAEMFGAVQQDASLMLAQARPEEGGAGAGSAEGAGGLASNVGVNGNGGNGGNGRNGRGVSFMGGDRTMRADLTPGPETDLQVLGAQQVGDDVRDGYEVSEMDEGGEDEEDEDSEDEGLPPEEEDEEGAEPEAPAAEPLIDEAAAGYADVKDKFDMAMQAIQDLEDAGVRQLQNVLDGWRDEMTGLRKAALEQRREAEERWAKASRDASEARAWHASVAAAVGGTRSLLEREDEEEEGP